MRILITTFLSLVYIHLTVANAQPISVDYSKLSETMRAKCNNTQDTSIRYSCTLDNEGHLVYLLREDSISTDKGQYYISKKVWLNRKNEQLTQVEEYNENGDLKLVVHFDEQQRAIQTKSYTDQREIIKNFQAIGNNLNLSSQHIIEDKRYSSGFSLDWILDKNTGKSFVNKWIQFGADQKKISAFASPSQLNCHRSQLAGRVAMMLAEGMGMDVNLPRFEKYLIYNSSEKINGQDSDSNGLVDDCVGFHAEENRTSNLSMINPVISDDGGELQGVNHGTMVADIATRGNSKILLYPASGSILDPVYYEKMNLAIQANKIRMVNMSFTFAKKSSPRLDSRESMADAQFALETLMQSNPKTLFVAASGNGPFEFPSNKGINVDSWKQYPVSFNFDHMITVGAVETSEIKKEMLPEYRLALYSNYGLDSVDILAPGTGVHMQKPGGLSTETTKGTSFSTPYVSNIISQAMIINPSLSALEIKELLIKTVFIPNLDAALKFKIDNADIRNQKAEIRKKFLDENPLFLPVRSGGIIFPDRFLAAAKWLSVHPTKTVEEAALFLRSKKEFLAPTESGSEQEALKLLSLWKSRGL